MPQRSRSDKSDSNPLYLDFAKVGAALKEIGTDYQEIEDLEVKTRWFRDQQSETDVFIWIGKDKKIIKQQISVMGLIVEWNALEGVRTGMIMESELKEESLATNDPTEEGSLASEMIYFDKFPQIRTLETALSILKNTTCMEEDLIQIMIKNFRQALPYQFGLTFPDVRLPTRIIQLSQSLSHNNTWIRIKKFILSCFKK